MKRATLIAAIVLSFAAGSPLGASAIHRPIANAPADLPIARHPWNPKDVMGLIGSVGIRTLAGHLVTVPSVILETDRTFALALPAAGSRVHFVLVPKKDIRDIGHVSADHGAYLTDLFLTARHLVERKRLHEYRIYTNGPGLQSVGYLHFHLVGRKPSKN